MSKESFGAIFDESDARYKAQVMHATWGHLDPKCGSKHKGMIEVAVSQRGDSMVLRSQFNTPDSIILGEAISYIHGKVDGRRIGVYRWHGHLVRFKNGNVKLTAGTIKRVY